MGMEKWGAEFVSYRDGRCQEFRFARGWDKSLPMAYQVRRSEFDEILIRRAAQLGAQVIEGCRVREVDFLETRDAVRVRAEHDDGRSSSWSADYVVDASGRDTFLGDRLQSQAPRQETQ